MSNEAEQKAWEALEEYKASLVYGPSRRACFNFAFTAGVKRGEQHITECFNLIHKEYGHDPVLEGKPLVDWVTRFLFLINNGTLNLKFTEDLRFKDKERIRELEAEIDALRKETAK